MSQSCSMALSSQIYVFSSHERLSLLPPRLTRETQIIIIIFYPSCFHSPCPFTPRDPMNSALCSNCNVICLGLPEVLLPPRRSSKKIDIGPDKRTISILEMHMHADTPLTITSTMRYQRTAIYLQYQVFEQVQAANRFFLKQSARASSVWLGHGENTWDRLCYNSSRQLQSILPIIPTHRSFLEPAARW
jgi:hypothetical protein